MDLVDAVVEGGDLLHDRFHVLTEPRSAGMSLSYAKLLLRYIEAYKASPSGEGVGGALQRPVYAEVPHTAGGVGSRAPSPTEPDVRH